MNQKIICLVLPRFKYPSGDLFLGLSYISSYVKKKVPGVDVKLIDTTFNASLNFVEKELDKYNPSLVGIYMGTLMFSYALKVAKLAKNRGMHVIIGGPHPSILPNTVIGDDSVDSIVLGEGELTFCEYLEEFFGGNNFSKVQGVWFKDNQGRIIKNGVREPIHDLDSLPFADYDIYDVERYIRNWIPFESVDPKLRGLPILASRGCPFRCAYCQPTLNQIFGKALRIRSPENVVEELKYLKDKYKINCFYFMDDTLTAIKPWVIRFSFLLIEENINMKWICNTRADTYDLEMLTIMKKSGLVKIKVGIESICDRIRNGILGKRISQKQITSIIDDCEKLGIQTAGFFMIGAPTETKKEIMETIKYAVSSKIMEASFTITTPLPETYLYDIALKNNWTTPEKYEDFDYYRAPEGKGQNGLRKRSLDIYKTLAYLLFYLHPKRLIKTIRMSASIGGFRRTLLKLKRL